MKAIVIKNNTFETIGLEVTASGKTVFAWGISSQLKYNFQKEIDVNDWMTEIFELVRIEARINEEEEFARRWFEIAAGQKLLKKDQGVNFKQRDEELKRLNERLVNIIKNII